MVDVTPANPAPATERTEVLLSRGDRIGMFGSLLCAIHCALLPLVLAALPTLSFGFRRHRAFHAWVFLVPGLVLVWLASFSSLHDHSFWHVMMMVAGGASMATAHFVNLRLTHRFARPRRGLAGG